jgi:multidrug transporter EmrE-like cation transporter
LKACFVHNQVEHKTGCPFCGKNYCSNCLHLVGKRKTVICRSCYEHFLQKIKRSQSRRYVFILTGFIIAILSLYMVFQSLQSDVDTTILYIISGGLGLFSIMFNVVRLQQYKSWEVVYEYPERNKTLN